MSTRTLLPALMLLFLSGCTTQAPIARVRISGGERITIDLKQGGVVGAENNAIKVRIGGLVANAKDKQATFVFALEFKAGDAPRSIKIEDVTDEKAQVFVEDLAPKLVDRIWNWGSAPMAADADVLKWVREIDDSFRVCRFTVILADGRRLCQYQSSFYSAFNKARLRKQLGGEP